jgi:hypothetical protein
LPGENGKVHSESFHDLFIPDIFSGYSNFLPEICSFRLRLSQQFHVASILLAVKANFYERKRRKDKVRKCCRFLGLYAGEEVILDESSVPIPDPEPTVFLSGPAVHADIFHVASCEC